MNAERGTCGIAVLEEPMPPEAVSAAPPVVDSATGWGSQGLDAATEGLPEGGEDVQQWQVVSLEERARVQAVLQQASSEGYWVLASKDGSREKHYRGAFALQGCVCFLHPRRAPRYCVVAASYYVQRCRIRIRRNGSANSASSPFSIVGGAASLVPVASCNRMAHLRCFA